MAVQCSNCTVNADISKTKKDQELPHPCHCYLLLYHSKKHVN